MKKGVHSIKLTKPHISAKVYGAYFKYLKTEFPEIDIKELCAEAGLTYEYLTNESNWVSVIFDERFTRLCLEKTKKSDFCYHVGAQNVSPEVIGKTTATLLKYIASQKFIYSQLPKLTSLFSRVTEVNLINISRKEIKLLFFPLTKHLSANEQKALSKNIFNIFQNTLGHYAAVPTIYGLPPAIVNYKVLSTSDSKFPAFELLIEYENSSSIFNFLLVVQSILLPFLLVSFFIPRETTLSERSLLWSSILFLSFWLLFYMRRSLSVQKGFNKTVQALQQSDQRYNEIYRAKEHLRKISSANGKFIPWKLLEILQCKSILDLRLGSGIEKEMTVMFADIRNFTKISDQMPPKQTFNLLNNYLKRTVPIINNNNGFVDKFLGDGILAIFPHCPNDAVQAASQIIKEINFKKNTDQSQLKVGIAINTGKVILGVIGNLSRLQGTVISDCVNTTARLEEMNKHFGTSLLVTESTLKGLSKDIASRSRCLGQVSIKGKKKPMTVFEIQIDELQEKEETKSVS